jgi:POT family proton-dependent oligopeptide transporter
MRQYFPAFNTIYITQPLFNACFYGLKSIFVLYVISQFSLTEEEAISLFATFMSLCYATTLIGGYVADNGLGIKNTVTFGGVLTGLGLLFLLFPSEDLCFLGLALVSLGSGCFKPNLLASVGLTFKNPRDSKKDGAYSLIYTFGNLGGLVLPATCGFVGKIYGFHYSIILVAAIFASATYLYYITMQFRTSNEQGFNFFRKALFWLLLSLIALLYALFKYRELFHGTMGIIASGSIVYFGTILFRCSAEEKRSVLTAMCYVLLFAVVCTLGEQAGSSMILFFEKAVDRNVLGMLIPSSVFLSLNPFFVLICSPILIILSAKYLEKTKPVSGFVKSGIGFLLTAISFGILALSTIQASNSLISPTWIVLAIFVQTLGELWIVPVGLSQISQNSPQHLQSVMMSFWTMAIAYAHYMGGFIALYSLTKTITDESSSHIYRNFFFSLGSIPLVVGFLVLLYCGLKPLILRKQKST